MWDDEKLSTSTKNDIRFGMCCLGGQVDLPQINGLPDEILKLISDVSEDGKNFRSSIRLYNSILAFTSTSANIDKDLMNASNGVYTYRIQGSVHHKISSYLPNPNFKPTFSQMYIYDSDMQTSIRGNMFPSVIKASILNTIQKLLELNNPYVKIYMQVGKTISKDSTEEYNIVLKSNVSYDRTRNKPSSNEIAALIVNNDQTTTNKRDTIIRPRNENDQLMFVNENLHMYDPLAYPLMHIFGESGWQYNMYKKRSKESLLNWHSANESLLNFNQVNSIHDDLNFNQVNSIHDALSHETDGFDEETNSDGTTKPPKYVTLREFYAYRLQDRPSNFF